MRIILSLLLTVYLGSGALCQGDAEDHEYKLPEDAAFTIEDVKIERVVKEGSSFEISGALRVPTLDRPESGFPAVLFISGSGSQTKHGFGRIDIGSWELLDAVADAGFVVLSTDDRGVGNTPIGEEGFERSGLGYDELVGDARSALNYLRDRDEVDAGRVFLIGHSEGGLTAPILADEFDCAGVVFMAAMGRNLYDVTLEQVENAMKDQPAAVREQNLKAQREYQDAVKEDREPDFNILGDAAAANLKAVWEQRVKPIKAWWHDHFNLDVPEIHGAVSCPCFVAQGARDFQVKPTADARRIVKNLLEGECVDIKFKVYDDLDHLFKPCNGRESSAELYREDRRVSGEFKDDVVNWLKSRK